jgi:hypothetical protein
VSLVSDAPPTRFYLLEQDLYQPGTWGVVSSPGDLDPVDLLDGAGLTPRRSPVDVGLSDSSGDARPDIIISLLPLFSARLRSALDAAGVDNIQYFDAHLRHPGGYVVERGYFVANVLGRVRAVDRKASRFGAPTGAIPGDLLSFNIQPEAVRDLRLFRLDEDPTLIVIDEPLKVALESAGLVGLELLPTTRWTGIPGQG